MNSIFNKLDKTYPKEVDLTNMEHSEMILQTVELILNEGASISDCEEMEQQLLRRNGETPIFLLLSLKIAKSKLLTSKVKEPLFISLIFAVYKEHHRILKPEAHPHGEDFLLRKVKQLEWLFDDHPQIDWEMIIVDDGCPEGSGTIAKNIIDAHNLNHKVRVLYLEEAIKENHPVTRGMRSTADSQKGGSIVYGMWESAQRIKSKNHIVCYTDADLSTHLGQLMLLVAPLLTHKKMAALGSRREPNSIVIKKGNRNNRGKLFIYLWKRLIPNLGEIVDTQCGFKAFRAEIIPLILDNLIEKKFAFDIELLLKTELHITNALAKVPIAWIDSEAASTTTDLQPYLPMLRSIVKMNRMYFPKDKESDQFAKFIESLDEQKFTNILNAIPLEITNRNPDEFTTYNGVSVDDLVQG